MAVSNGKVYYISGYAGGGYYLNRWGSGAVSNHQNVTLYTKTPDPDQQWKLKSVTGGYQILSMLNNAYGLNIYPPNNNNCDLYPVAGNENDAKITLIAVNASQNIYRIKLTNYSYYLTAVSNSSGANVYWAASNGSTSQQWKFEEVSSGGSDTSKTLSLPSNRSCNWNQFYTEIVNVAGNVGCSITCGLDVANFYDPTSYTINDLKNYWGSGGYSWALPSSCNGKIMGYSHGTEYTDTQRLATIRSEINANRPVIIKIVSSNVNDTHFVVAYGYRNGGTTNDNILVFDPANNGSGATGRDTTLANAISWSSKTRMLELRLTQRK